MVVKIHKILHTFGMVVREAIINFKTQLAKGGFLCYNEEKV